MYSGGVDEEGPASEDAKGIQGMGVATVRHARVALTSCPKTTLVCGQIVVLLYLHKRTFTKPRSQINPKNFIIKKILLQNPNLQAHSPSEKPYTMSY